MTLDVAPAGLSAARDGMLQVRKIGRVDIMNMFGCSLIRDAPLRKQAGKQWLGARLASSAVAAWIRERVRRGFVDAELRDLPRKAVRAYGCELCKCGKKKMRQERKMRLHLHHK